jgi:hypothetical protein
MNEKKVPFLIGYEYGMGGLWGVIDARSEDEIKQKYPELDVVHERPKWMTPQRYGELCERERHDIDEETPWGILRAVVTNREQP